MGQPAHDRANKNRPVLSFRSPSEDFKDRVRMEAEKHGLSVQDYLLRAVESYMSKTPRPVSPKHDTDRDELAKALDELTGSFPPEFE